MKFLVNPKIPATVVHYRGAWRKGEVYDSVIERIREDDMKEMLRQNLNGIRFFIKAEQNKEA